MKLGAYTDCLHDKPLAEALVVLEGMNLTGAEINNGGFLVTPRVPVDALPASRGARDDDLDQFEGLQPAAETLNTAHATAGI